MSKQCLDISQMQHLKELGVDTSKASACWYRIIQNKGDGNIRVISDWKLTFSLDIAYCTGHTLESVRTFTLQDILDLLPEMTTFYKLNTPTCDLWYTKEDLWCNEKVSFEGENIIDTAYEALLWCIENKFVETNKED